MSPALLTATQGPGADTDAPPPGTACLIIDGPHADGPVGRRWYISWGDDAGNILLTIHETQTWAHANSWGQHLADQQGVEFVDNSDDE